jgi:hypothetical protein
MIFIVVSNSNLALNIEYSKYHGRMQTRFSFNKNETSRKIATNPQMYL